MHVDVRREAEVTRILTRDGRVQGVALADGNDHRSAGRGVERGCALDL